MPARRRPVRQAAILLAGLTLGAAAWATLGQAPPSPAAAVAARTAPAAGGAQDRALAGPSIAGPAGEGGAAARPIDPVATMTEARVQDRIQLVRMLAGEDLSGYVWPLLHGRITNSFGVGRPGSFVVDGDTIHDGIDLSTFCGDRILAAHDGLVIGTGRERIAEMGWLGDVEAYRARLDAIGPSSAALAVVIDDGDGFRSVYLHLAHTTVKAGDSVQAGQLIGYEGSTGHSTGCHLHFSLFSPAETRTYRLDSRTLAKLGIRIDEIARIDPLLAMPPLAAAGITWEWGARTVD